MRLRRKGNAKEPKIPEKPKEPTELEKLVYESKLTKSLSPEVKKRMSEDLLYLPLRNDNIRQAILTDLLEEAKKKEERGFELSTKSS